MSKMKPTTIKKAYEKAILMKMYRDIMGEKFAIVGWVHPETKRIGGPYLVKVYKNVAIELTQEEKFCQLYTGRAPDYIVWNHVTSVGLYE